jgi:hypothetical protein
MRSEKDEVRAARRNFALPPSHFSLQMVGGAGNAPARHFQLDLTTPGLQPGSRITSPVNRPAEPKLEAGHMARLRCASARQLRSRCASSEGW